MPIGAKTTIQIFLPDGEPRGIRIADITTQIVKAVQVPRARLDRLADLSELDSIAAYFLFGESDELAKRVAYVGQTENPKTRLKKHHADQEFWTTAVFLVSKTKSFTVAHIRYLEWYALKRATEVARYSLENGNAGSKPYVTEPIEADVLDAFDTGSILLSTLGFPLFEPVAGKPKTRAEQIVYRCAGPDAEARGRMVEDGFVVLKDSTARTEGAPHAHEYLATKRHAMIASGDLVQSGSTSLRFARDCLFGSPSGAARMVLGRNANGWIEWKTEDGRTLDAINRERALGPVSGQPDPPVANR